MKQETNNIIKLVEHKYGFDLCEKTEFVKQMIREFTKYEKKLAKIDNYEKMIADGKSLSKEVHELIKKKQSFIDHLRSLKEVTDTYVKTSNKHTEAVLEAVKDKIKAEVEKEIKELRERELKKLSNFLVIAEMLNEKDHISPTPLTKVPKEKQENILNSYTKLVKLTHNKDITMKGEAESLRETIRKLLANEDMTKYVEGIMGSVSVADVKFRINEGIEYEFVMLQPADKLEISELVKIELPKVNASLNKIEEQFSPSLEPKQEKKVKEVMKTTKVQAVEKAEKQIINGTESETASLFDGSQESEFEIAISRSTKREMRRELYRKRREEEDKIIEADEEEFDRKFLNHRYALRDD